MILSTKRYKVVDNVPSISRNLCIVSKISSSCTRHLHIDHINRKKRLGPRESPRGPNTVDRRQKTAKRTQFFRRFPATNEMKREREEEEGVVDGAKAAA